MRSSKREVPDVGSLFPHDGARLDVLGRELEQVAAWTLHTAIAKPQERIGRDEHVALVRRKSPLQHWAPTQPPQQFPSYLADPREALLPRYSFLRRTSSFSYRAMGRQYFRSPTPPSKPRRNALRHRKRRVDRNRSRNDSSLRARRRPKGLRSARSPPPSSRCRRPLKFPAASILAHHACIANQSLNPLLGLSWSTCPVRRPLGPSATGYSGAEVAGSGCAGDERSARTMQGNGRSSATSDQGSGPSRACDVRSR